MSEIIGHKGGKSGGASHTHYEATDSLQSISYARVLDLVSEGEIEGLADGLKSVFLDETPLQNADGTLNFKDVTVDFRPGSQTQDYIPGFPDVENEINIGVELRSSAPWVRAISNTALSAIRITLGVPALSKADTTNGDILGYKIDYQIELSTDGGAYAVVLSNSFNGKQSGQYDRSARIDLPPATSGWSLRVTRLTANANTVGISDTTTVISYTEVIDAKLRYPMSAIIGLQIDAKQFQSIPTRAYDLFGRIVQVPSNYDPKTRAYTGIWDGTFKPSWTNNPAWIFRDLVLNERYGLGARISAAQIDKWALYQIARYCDELVPNGKGGTEPRFTCNLYLQSQKAAYAVLQDIASIFRGISYWGGGSIIASADMPLDPVYVYTAANVINGKFSRVGTSKKTRYTVALVSWNDPADFYRAKVEYVEDPEGIARYGIQQAPMTAFGCTSQGQAQRVGRWALATSRLETEAITFDVGLDGAIALPGQIVRIADPARMGRRNGGRVRAAAGRVVALDKAPVINVGDSLTCILPTGVSQTRTVQSVTGDAVTVSSDWTALPAPQSVWSVDSSALIAPTFKILSVVEKDELTYTMTATQHEPGKFAFIENGTAIQPRPETSLDVSKQAAPASVSLSARTVSLQDVQKLVLVVSCPTAPGAVAYQGAYRFANGNWIDMPRQAEPLFEVVDVLAGNYTAKLSAVNSIGVVSLETQSPTLTIAKNVNPKNAAVLLSSTTPAFHVAADGSHSPNAITIGATLIDLEGAVTFTAAGATLSNITARSATVAFADMTATTALVTASIVSNGETISGSIYVNQVQDGAAGNDGPAGQRFANAELFQWSTVQPAAPTGTTTFTWANLANTSYTGSDGWATVPPANPGGPTVRLYRASRAISAAATATSSSVSYATATVAAITANGATGAAGVKAAPANAFRWAVGPAPTAAGTATFTWSTATYDTPPSGWSVIEPAAPGQGYTLYKAVVNLVDTAGTATTAIDWTIANIVGIGYMGVNGTGGAGSNGNSAMIAYTIIDGLTLNSTPDTITVSGQGRPSAGAWGSTRAWTDAPGVPVAGQALMQSNGIWNGTSTVWSLPYMSTFRVGSLSALSSNLGAITAGSIDIAGQASIDVNGHAIFKSFELVDPVSGQTILTAGGNLNPLFAAAGTKNSDIVVGGRNIYTRNTTFSDPTSSGSVFAERVADGFTLIGVSGTNCGFQRMAVPLKVGQYTLSFNLRLRDGPGILWLDLADTTTQVINQTTTADTHYELHFDVTNAGLAWLDFNKMGPQGYYFTKFKLEEGNKATSYTPAPEDVASDTAAAALTATWGGIPGGTGKAADYATVGAPAGTYVGGTEAGLVASRAANGDAAYNSISGINTAIADKLSKTSPANLAAMVTLQTGGALLAGTATNGVYLASDGIYCVQGGVVKVRIPISGDPTFGGQLLAPSGTLGSLHIAAGGGIHGGSWTQFGSPPAAGATGFYLGNEGLAVGDYVGGKYFVIYGTGRVESPYLNIDETGARFAGTLTAAGIITTANIQLNATKGIDTFGTMSAYSGGGQSIFNMSVSGGDIVILANVAYDGGSGAQGYNVERWNGSTWAYVTTMSSTGGMTNITITDAAAGDYRLMGLASYGYVTNVTVFKAKR